jgi:Na+/H+-dicarboxylate symporter
MAFALALRRVSGPAREVVARTFEAIRETAVVLIGWILAVAPIGVFALVLALTSRLGAAAAGALGYFVLIACVLVIVATLALYVVVAAVGRTSVRAFARAIAPAQAVGFTTRSSLAALPALVAGAEKLGVPAALSGLVLPLGVSVFKYASPIVRIVGTFFVAKLYGIELGPAQIAAIAAALGVLSFYSPGIPSGGLFVMSPIYLAFGLPIEGVGILIALDFIPDMFLTTANVTADLAVPVLLARSGLFRPQPAITEGPL